MQYNKRTVKSRPGMSQEDALESLQSHPQFVAGTKISSFRRRGKVWVADLLEPKTAGDFPPSDDAGSDSESPEPKAEESSPAPSSDGPADDSGSDSGDSPSGDSGSPDGPPSAGGDDKPAGPKGEGGGVEQQILHTLQQILHALQGGAPEPGLGGPDDLGPKPEGGPAPTPPAGGGAHGKPGFPGAPGAKLKPGEVPNKPGVTPVGAPAFASTHQGTSLPPGGPGAAPAPGAGAPAAQGPCPKCGQPQPCACQGGAPAPGGPVGGAPALAAALAKQASRSATITVKTPGPMNIKQAKALVDAAAPEGYSVKQAKYTDDGRVALLLSRR